MNNIHNSFHVYQTGQLFTLTYSISGKHFYNTAVNTALLLTKSVHYSRSEE